MRFTGRVVITLSALLHSEPGLTQQQQASEIVVTGTRDREEQVRDFVTALTPAPQGSIPRFIDEVCPKVVGLLPVHKEAVAARLREVAAAARIRVAPVGCVPNAFVIATPDKGAFIRALAKRQRDAFGMMSTRQIRRLADVPGPAAAWQLEGPVDADEIPLRWDETIGAYVNETTNGASRIRTMGRRGFDASAVVVEIGALKGLAATQLADYAAMRLFAKLDPARLQDPPPPTILTVLEAPMGTAVPITMTNWDFGLLSGLYTSPADLNANGQRSAIARRVNQQLDATSPKRD
jgi:hypothetical protein